MKERESHIKVEVVVIVCHGIVAVSADMSVDCTFCCGASLFTAWL